MPKIITDAGETLEIEREMGPVHVIQRSALKAEDGGEGASRRFKCIVSTPSVDRAGDIIEVDGIELENFMANPVILLQHDANRPIGKCVSIQKQGGKLVAEGEFAPPGISADADRVAGLVKAGVLSAVSIGVLPKEFSFINDKRPWDGTKYIKSEMLEFSIVALPMNAEALVIGRAAGPEAEAQRAALLALAKATEEPETVPPPAEPAIDDAGDPPSPEEPACNEGGGCDTAKAMRLRTVEVLRRKMI